MKEALKQTFTSYWAFLTLKAACKLDLFDQIHAGTNTSELLSSGGKLHPESLSSLLKALCKLDTIEMTDGIIHLKEDGEYLTASHPESLKEVCILWGEEHMAAWMNLDYSITTGLPAFEKIHGVKFFDYISKDPQKLFNYHKAMDAYAMDDYQNLAEIIDFSGHKSIMDVGGGLGYLINKLASTYPTLDCFLFDRPEVVKVSDATSVNRVGGDFFITIPPVAEALILSRVLHDWDDSSCSRILENCHTALPDKGVVYIIENLTDKIANQASLLSLNMLLMCQSYERTEAEYQTLLFKAGFTYESTTRINNIQYILKAAKR